MAFPENRDSRGCRSGFNHNLEQYSQFAIFWETLDGNARGGTSMTGPWKSITDTGFWPQPLLAAVPRTFPAAKVPVSALQRGLAATAAQVRWPVGHVFVPDPRGRYLESARLWHLDRPELYSRFCQVTEETQLAPGVGIAGQAWQSGELEWTNGPVRLERLRRGQALAAVGLRTGFAFPVMVDAAVVAVLEFYHFQAAAIDQPLQEVVRIIGHQMSDALQKERYEEQLVRMAAVIDSVNDAVISRTSDGRITSWNRGAERIFGYSSQEALRQNMSLLLPKGMDEEYEIVRALAERRRIENFETVRRRKDGELIMCSVNVSPIVDYQGQFVGAISVERDVTYRKREEAELRRARRDVELANRVRGEFLANISHELRTPLNSILGTTQAALEEGLSDSVRDLLNASYDSAQSLLNMVNNLLDLTRLEAGVFVLEKRAFDLREAVQETVAQFSQRALEKHLALECHIDPQLPPHLVGDAVRLRQVISHLLSNAVRFTEQGRVDVKVRLVRNWPEESQVVFTVIDTGVGIEPGECERLLEPFVQADASPTRRDGGVGIGLSICNKLLKLLGSRLMVNSQPGHGSSFSFCLSFPRLADVDTQPCLPRNLPLGLRPLTILLAEDLPANQKVVTHVLERRGHTVIVASNGREAVDLFGTRQFDLVLMDIQMPVMDGFQATGAIRKLEQHRECSTPIVAMTAHVMTGDRERCLEAGMDTYIAKPVDIAGLLSLVASVASSRPRDARSAMSDCSEEA